MSPALIVRVPGLHTTVQDLGRWGYQAIGVPVSGALDSEALRLANALVGNPPGAAALELIGSGPSLEIAADTARFAAAGAVIEMEGETVRGQSVTLNRGALCRIALDRECGCGYVAVEGGVAVPSVMGSAATFVRGGIGGLEGRPLRAGDRLPLALAAAASRPELRLRVPLAPRRDQPIRVVLGPQQDQFTEAAIATLLGAEFRISASADRMGMRLDGPRLEHRDGWDIVSDAIATGAIQVPGSGQAILLLADHQTTGGYPKIATVVSADLPLVARRRPGDAIRFTAVSAAAAEALAGDAEREFLQLLATLEPVPQRVRIDPRSLWRSNLISGVVSARD